jgi:hypothetical protein
MPTDIDNLTGASKAYKIEIYSFSNVKLGNTNTISFPAFLTDFSDSYKSEWNPQKVLGKMDPISTFKNTTRTINLVFDIPNYSIKDAKDNLDKISYIIKGLYPVYSDSALGTATLASPPMFRVRFANFVRNSAASEEDGSALRTGLLCYFNSFDFKPDNGNGYFVDGNDLYPKLIKVSLTLNIIHEHPLGKTTNANGLLNRTGFENFPYNKAVTKPTDPSKNGGIGAPADSQTASGNDAKANGVLGAK